MSKFKFGQIVVAKNGVVDRVKVSGFGKVIDPCGSGAFVNWFVDLPTGYDDTGVDGVEYHNVWYGKAHELMLVSLEDNV